MTEPCADISVIIPAYNNADTIGRALASVAGQSLRPRQVVVVDDGSTDDTFACASACASLLPGIDLVVRRQDNVGAGAARNHAISLASGSWLAFLDADDEWRHDKLKASLAHLHDGDLAFVSHDMEVVTTDGAVLLLDCARHFQSARDPFAALFQRGFVATSTVVARRDLVQAAGGFDPNLRAAQDYDLWLRLAVSHRFLVFSGALTRYHTNANGITANVERRRQCSLAVLERHRAALRGAWRGLVVAKRLAIIHYEAATAFRHQGRPGAAITTVLQLIGETVRVFPRTSAGLAWIWVLAVIFGYLSQFIGNVGALLALLGVSR